MNSQLLCEIFQSICCWGKHIYFYGVYNPDRSLQPKYDCHHSSPFYLLKLLKPLITSQQDYLEPVSSREDILNSFISNCCFRFALVLNTTFWEQNTTILVLLSCCLVIVGRVQIWIAWRHMTATYDSKTKLVVFYSLSNAFSEVNLEKI